MARVGLLPLLTLPVRLVRVPPLRLRLQMQVRGLVRSPPPPPHGCPGVGGSRSKSDRSVSDRDGSPQPGPLGLGSGSRSSSGADWSRSEFGGRSSPAPSVAADDDRSSTLDSVDLDKDDSFRSVLRLIRDFHSSEEPASVAPNRCKTSLAPVYGLQSESSPTLHLPLSPLLRYLLEDTNSALFKFVEDQTVHGFLPVPGCLHQRCYRTSSSSFPGLYAVPPGLTSITLEKVSESRKRSVSLSHSQVSSLETMLTSVCGVTSWLDLWEFPGASNRRRAWQLRAVDALWIESLVVPGWPGRHGSR